MSFLIKGRTDTGSDNAGAKTPSEAISKMAAISSKGAKEVTCVDEQGRSYTLDDLRSLADAETTKPKDSHPAG